MGPLLWLSLAVLASAPAAARSQSSSSPPSPLPETDWLSAAGHGVFTHFLEGLQSEFGRNSGGLNSSWNECVDAFNAEAYAADAAATGAKYAFITIMQGSNYTGNPTAPSQGP